MREREGESVYIAFVYTCDVCIHGERECVYIAFVCVVCVYVVRQRVVVGRSTVCQRVREREKAGMACPCVPKFTQNLMCDHA